MWQTLALNIPVSTVGSNLCVDQSMVQRVVNVFEMTGSVSKRPYHPDRSIRKITKTAEFYIISLMQNSKMNL